MSESAEGKRPDTVRVQVEGNGASWDGLPGVLKRTDLGRWQELRLEQQRCPRSG